mgnify:FL=1
MIKDIKYTEKKGYLKAILKNEYPSFISKDFSEKVMLKIYAQKQQSPIKSYMLRIASAFIFGIFTLFVVDNILTEDIKYTKTTINDHESIAPSQNVSTQIEECKNISDNDLSSDIIECK